MVTFGTRVGKKGSEGTLYKYPRDDGSSITHILREKAR